MEKFAIGLIIGGIGGALLTANNYKMRTLVRKTQEELQTKFDQMLDEKMQSMGETAESVKAPADGESKPAANTAKKTAKASE